ncbi:FAD-dependent oxidoreductase, partial [Paraclostridium benzoelyticum]|nr:FAD-dependent oxidoreductase [Paraclostridium benzoelyticum]
FYAADSIRKRNKTAKIALLSNEEELSYYRPALSDFINEEIKKEDFYIEGKEWYEKNNIEVLLGINVETIDEENKKIILDNNSSINYDKLIIANGSSNFIPPINGNNLDGVYTLRNKNDLDKIKMNLEKAKNILVIGGGLLGLEAAYEMKLAQKEVTVVEAMPNLLTKQLDKDGSVVLENILKENGLNLMLGKFIDFLEGDKKVSKAVFKDGSSIDVDMVVFSIGVRPNIQITNNTNIEVNRGIVVDKHMKTSSKEIYACGDVAEIDSMIWAIWPAAIDMGKVAGANACGDKIEFKVENYPVGLDVFETKVFSIGNINDVDSFITLNKKDVYKKLFFKDDVLVGAVCINDLSKNVNIINLIEEKANFNKVLSENLL